jgi:DNA-binding LytR/AlgR family response regulator
MKVLIIEDENPASQKLIRLLKNVDPKIEIMHVLKSVEESINWFIKNPAPDLIFMDVQLEDGLSFDILENCKIDRPVIFTTAYDEYAIKAFKVNSVDYLLKPIAQNELKHAIEKFNHVHRINYLNLESIVKQLHSSKKERFLIKVGERYKSVSISNIHCFYIRERGTFLFTDKGKSYPVDYSLEQLEQLVDSTLFFRVNRTHIINFHAIKEVFSYSSGRLKIILINPIEKDEIVVSRERVSDFKNWMDG